MGMRLFATAIDGIGLAIGKANTILLSIGYLTAISGSIIGPKARFFNTNNRLAIRVFV
jgi:hypothetical protein